MVYLNSDEEEVRFNESAFISLLGLGKIHGHLRRGGQAGGGGTRGDQGRHAGENVASTIACWTDEDLAGSRVFALHPRARKG